MFLLGAILALGYERSSKRIEHVLIKHISKLNRKIQLALNHYLNSLERQIPRFKSGNYRLDIGSNLPHVLAPIPLLGTYWFNIEKLYFDVKLSNPFREDVRVLFSNKILIPAFSLTLSSFVTVRRWVREHMQGALDFIIHSDKPLTIQRGNYSFLNFYYFRSLEPLEIHYTEYLNMILRDMLILLTLFPLPTIRNKLQDLCKLLPYLSIYGSDISGVEALSVTRCLLKLDHRSLESRYCKRVSIRSLLWGEIPAYRVKALVVSNNSLSGKPSIINNETIYIPELYFMRLLEKYDTNSLLIDSIIMSLFIIKRVSGDPQRDLVLFNILAMPLNVYPLDSNVAALAALDFTIASTCSFQFTNTAIKEGSSLERVLDTNLTFSESDLASKAQHIFNALWSRQMKPSLSTITVRIPGRGLSLSGLLSYAYTYLLPFSNEYSFESQYRRNLISIPCYSPYTLLPTLAFALLKNFDFEAFKELLRRIVLALKKKSYKEDISILVTLKDELSGIAKNSSYVEYNEICGLVRDIMLAWRLYTIRLKYSQWILKYENSRGDSLE